MNKIQLLHANRLIPLTQLL